MHCARSCLLIQFRYHSCSEYWFTDYRGRLQRPYWRKAIQMLPKGALLSFLTWIVEIQIKSGFHFQENDLGELHVDIVSQLIYCELAPLYLLPWQEMNCLSLNWRRTNRWVVFRPLSPTQLSAGKHDSNPLEIASERRREKKRKVCNIFILPLEFLICRLQEKCSDQWPIFKRAQISSPGFSVALCPACAQSRSQLELPRPMMG